MAHLAKILILQVLGSHIGTGQSQREHFIFPYLKYAKKIEFILSVNTPNYTEGHCSLTWKIRKGLSQIFKKSCLHISDSYAITPV